MKFIKKYKYVFFDLDNTLWDFNKNSYYALQEAFFHFNISNQAVEYEKFHEVYIRINHLLWKEYRKKAIPKKDLIRLRFENTFAELNVFGIDPVEINDYYLSVMPVQKVLVDGTEEILNYLKSKSCSLYIITNGFSEVQHKKLENSGLITWFSKVFISEDIKSPKPSKEIFEYAVKSANAKKATSIMIGDDWEVDVEGAFNVGIDAVYFSKKTGNTGFEKFCEKVKSNLVYRINDLTEIKKII
jgi:putative hydrolase of the HAD superfamily